jgi:Raf kinase inhibitor-like YbhB/YbcL family protein
MLLALGLAILASLALACGNGEPEVPPGAEFGVESSAFAEGEVIPLRYTCDGDDVSPPISWEAPPPDTRSFALVVHDPDAPMGTWYHWILYNIPADVRQLPEDIPSAATVAGVGIQGTNSWGRPGYGGPCPPVSSEHRYFFALYALDTELALAPGADRDGLVEAMTGHILARGQLMGRFSR